MRIIDYNKKCSIKYIGIYLTSQEAKQFRSEINNLLKDPEANKHFHVYSDDHSREISCSIVTEKKLKNVKNYNKLEQQILTEK